MASARHAQPKTRAHAKISQLSAPRGRLSLSKLYLGEQRPSRLCPVLRHPLERTLTRRPSAGQQSKDRKIHCKPPDRIVSTTYVQRGNAMVMMMGQWVLPDDADGSCRRIHGRCPGTHGRLVTSGYYQSRLNFGRGAAFIIQLGFAISNIFEMLRLKLVVAMHCCVLEAWRYKTGAWEPRCLGFILLQTSEQPCRETHQVRALRPTLRKRVPRRRSRCSMCQRTSLRTRSTRSRRCGTGSATATSTSGLCPLVSGLRRCGHFRGRVATPRCKTRQNARKPRHR